MLGRDVSQLSDDQLRNIITDLERSFRDEGLTSTAQLATIILQSIKANRWRIIVGVDAQKIDEMVRDTPDSAYDVAFFDQFARAAGWTERLYQRLLFAPAELITGLSPSSRHPFLPPARFALASFSYPCRKRRSASRVSRSACLVTRAFVAWRSHDTPADTCETRPAPRRGSTDPRRPCSLRGRDQDRRPKCRLAASRHIRRPRGRRVRRDAGRAWLPAEQ